MPIPVHVKAGAPCASKPPLTLLAPPQSLDGAPQGLQGLQGQPRMAHSLPRRKASVPLGGPGDEFGRNGPARRSAGPGGVGLGAGRPGAGLGRLSPEPLLEYFVPRSVSEFNLAGVVAEEDEAMLVPEPPGPPKMSVTPHLPILRPPGAAGAARKLGMASSRSREKMVTFEDDAAGMSAPSGDVFM